MTYANRISSRIATVLLAAAWFQATQALANAAPTPLAITLLEVPYVIGATAVITTLAKALR